MKTKGIKRICAAAILAATTSHGAGLLIADGGFGGVLEIVEHDVKVTINNGVAVTHVNQVFRNTENRIVEALYTFPVPEGASVANFSMWINGKEMVGEVVEKERAREIYNSYKQKKHDPGLLEQTDYKTFEMRIFPIPAGADQRVQITYYQELKVDHDWATYVYPLATATKPGLDTSTKGKFAITLETKSAIPIVAMESPSHGDEFVIAKHSDNIVEASLETDGGSLAKDVVLAYNLSRPKTGIDMIASKQAGEDGFFSMTVTVGEDLKKMDTGMDYVFVMDISGSMANDGKLAMSKNSVSEFIKALSPDDRFEVLTFNVQPNTLFDKLVPATEESTQSAEQFMLTQSAKGGTVLRPALDAAYRYNDPDRQLNVVILSDGMTEQKERQLLLQLISARPRNARVFCIGVGNEVNRPLLQQIAKDSGGLAAFISQGDRFDRQAAAFRRKLMRPAASNLQVDFGGLQVYDVEPRVLPDLYHGSPVRIYGRYKDGGTAKVTLKADVRGVPLQKSAEMQFPQVDADNPEIERMWAWHRIDQLLKAADRTGSRKEVLNEVIALGEGYSIVTEYTSFLVLENDQEFKRWKIERRNRDRIGRDRTAQKKLRDELDAIRNKAVTDLGPTAAPKEIERQAVPQQTASNKPHLPAPVRTQPQNNGRGFDLDFGTGPVGPLFIGLMAWLKRKKARA